jgi:putative DNA primase/helicase
VGGAERRPQLDPTIIPEELRSRPQWVVWRHTRFGRAAKVPYDARTGRLASVTHRDTWVSFQDAIQVCGQYDGVGFVLSADDPLVGVDLDHCRDPQTGIIASWADEIITALSSYTEITPSGTGIRIFTAATLPPAGRKRGHIEIYDREHFLTVTGWLIPGTPTTVENRTAAIASLHRQYFPIKGPADGGLAHLIPQELTQTDEEILRRALSVTNGTTFSRLWCGDSTGYPSQSEADLALTSILSYWTGNDAAQVDHLFRQSGLYRPKWDEVHAADGRSYGELTINAATTDGQKLNAGNSAQVCTIIAMVDIAVQTQAWPGCGGASEYAVLRAHLALAWKLNNIVYDVAVRTIANIANLSPATVTRAQHRLQQKGWLLLIRGSRGIHAATWALMPIPQRTWSARTETHRFPLHTPVSTVCSTECTPVGLGHDCWTWAGLGKATGRVWERLDPQHAHHVKDLVAVLGVKRRTVYKHLARLAVYGLAAPQGDGNWRRGTADPTAVAQSVGTAGMRIQRIERHAQEQRRWRDLVEAQEAHDHRNTWSLGAPHAFREIRGHSAYSPADTVREMAHGPALGARATTVGSPSGVVGTTSSADGGPDARGLVEKGMRLT